MNLNLGHEVTEILVRRRVYHLLHHVVAVLVLDHGAEGGVLLTHLGNQSAPLVTARIAHALLHHVTGELVLGEHEDPALDLGDDPRLVGGDAVVEDVLYHVVAVLVQQEVIGAGQQLGQQAISLGGAAVLQQSLHYPAAVWVTRELHILQTQRSVGSSHIFTIGQCWPYYI